MANLFVFSLIAPFVYIDIIRYRRERNIVGGKVSDRGINNRLFEWDDGDDLTLQVALFIVMGISDFSNGCSCCGSVSCERRRQKEVDARELAAFNYVAIR